jgi:hypothetical protein
LPALIAAGLAGLECYYGLLQPAEIQPILDVAARHGLIATGGSDFHGTDGPLIAPLGMTQVPASAVEALQARHTATPRPRNEEPGTRNQERGTRNEEPGTIPKD